MRSRLILTVVLALAMFGTAYGKSLEEETPALVQTLAKQLVAKQRPKVATLDFTNIQGQPNELGRFLAEQLAVDMVTAEGITVIDRANINSVMAEHQLTAEGLVKPENAKKLGQFAGVDALLIGNVAAMDNVFTLTVKAISTETAEVVAAGRMKFDVTQDSMKQFGTVLSGGAAASMAGGNAANGTPSSQEATGIAKQTFDNLEIVLKTVATASSQLNNGNLTPIIRCSFELYNRDLRNAVVIAANGNLERYGVRLGSNRGELSDCNGVRWQMAQLGGLPSVVCFECTSVFGGEVAQNNPGAIADYIKGATKCDFGASIGQRAGIQDRGRYWAGSLSSIPPAKSIRVTADFSPDTRDRSPKIPQSFQFNMELVIGSVATGEDPGKAKDLRLENLTFDKIVMSAATEKK